MSDFGARVGLSTNVTEIGLREHGRLPPEVETVVCRIVQESLTNEARHAQAQNVSVLTRRENGLVQVMIEDDGRGFDVEEALRRGRLGIIGMRERAEMVGGKLEVESAVGGGTTVIVDLPLRAAVTEDDDGPR